MFFDELPALSSFTVDTMEERTLMSASPVAGPEQPRTGDEPAAIHVSLKPGSTQTLASTAGETVAANNINRWMQMLLKLGTRLHQVRTHMANLRLEAGNVSHAQGEDWDPSRWNDIYDHLIETRWHQSVTLALKITQIEKRLGLGNSSGSIALVNIDLHYLKLDARTERDNIRNQIPTIKSHIITLEYHVSKGVPGAAAELAKQKASLAKHEKWLPTVETVRSEWARELRVFAPRR